MNYRRVVVKVGSGVLSAGKERLDQEVISRLAGEIAALRGQGVEAVVVSSGAILAGREKLKLRQRPKATQLKQAAAAVGQSRLMRAWEAAFARRKLSVAQILLTREDLRQRARYLNARATIEELLRLGVVPVINENDTVATDEIKFGDNDVLSALVVGLCAANLLVLLTDQEGVFTADPRKDPRARLISRADDGAEMRLGKPGPAGSGGMESKVRAARLAAAAGADVIVASGARAGVLLDAAAGKPVGTLFCAKSSGLDRRRQWLAFASQPRGRVEVDEGARKALSSGAKSLLPSGIRSVCGRFEAGEAVSLVCGGVEFARGLTNYGSEELDRIKGLRTAQIEGVLGRKGAGEVVHRDRLALVEP